MNMHVFDIDGLTDNSSHVDSASGSFCHWNGVVGGWAIIKSEYFGIVIALAPGNFPFWSFSIHLSWLDELFSEISSHEVLGVEKINFAYLLSTADSQESG